MTATSTLSVVGVGLLGGSLALAARRRRVAARVIGTDREPLALQQALAAGILDETAPNLERALAVTSHLPHLVAAALAGALPPEWRGLTGTGFRDTTRLAAGSPTLWTAIFQSNADAVLGALDRLDGQLERFRAALASGDAELL